MLEAAKERASWFVLKAASQSDLVPERLTREHWSGRRLVLLFS